METTVKQRLIEFIEYKGISINMFLKQCGLSGGYIRAMRVSMQPDAVSKVATAFPDLNTGWLLTGVGDMLLRPEEKNLNIGGTVIGRDAYNNNINSTINADAEVERLRLELTLAQKQIEQLKEQIKAKDEQIIGLISAVQAVGAKG